MLVKKVSFYDFVEEFEKHGRENQFSDKGKEALYNYLNELGEDIGEPIELDVVGICCDFTEYESLTDFNHDYQLNLDDIDDISYYTTVIPIDGKAFIIHDF